MARNTLKASKKNLVCKIINIEKDPKHPNRMIVAVRIDDGDPIGPWTQGFSLLPEKTFTISDFMSAMYKQELKRPEDPYKELRQWKESGKEFELKLTQKLDGPVDK